MNSKICMSCRNEKEYKMFSKKISSKDGLQNYCKDCVSAYAKEYYKKNKQKMDAANKEYASRNKEKISEYKKQYDKENKDALNRQKYKWKESNKAYYAHKSAERRFAKKNSEILDSGSKRVKSIYLACHNISKRSGVPHHVDHIVPLINDNVCGLHVWWNLRIVSAKSNMKKSNFLEDSPQYWDHLERSGQ